MIELKEKKTEIKEPKYSKEDLAHIEKELISSAAIQKELGLGDPTNHLNAMTSGMITAKNRYKAMELAKHFPEVETPADGITVFKYTSESTIVSLPGVHTEAPKVAMVRLHKTLAGLRVQGPDNLTTRLRTDHECMIPTMPPSVLEAAQKAKELVNDIEFHLVFEPNWEKSLQPDPILLAKTGEHWFQVAAWGGDLPLIQELIVKKH